MMYQDPDQAGGQYQLNAAQGAAHDLGRAFTQMINPLHGLGRTVGGVSSALDSPDPGNALSRLFITGQVGNSLDWQAIERETFGPAVPVPQPQLAPYSNPVSGARIGQPLPQPQGFQGPAGGAQY
jgi:hypothetical protein